MTSRADTRTAVGLSIAGALVGAGLFLGWGLGLSRDLTRLIHRHRTLGVPA